MTAQLYPVARLLANTTPEFRAELRDLGARLGVDPSKPRACRTTRPGRRTRTPRLGTTVLTMKGTTMKQFQLAGLRLGELLVLTCIMCGLVMCVGSQLQVQNPVELCAVELAKLPTMQDEAAKVGLSPLDFTRKICDAAWLAAKVGKTQVAPTATTPSASAAIPASVNVAGSGG